MTTENLSARGRLAPRTPQLVLWGMLLGWTACSSEQTTPDQSSDAQRIDLRSPSGDVLTSLKDGGTILPGTDASTTDVGGASSQDSPRFDAADSTSGADVSPLGGDASLSPFDAKVPPDADTARPGPDATPTNSDSAPDALKPDTRDTVADVLAPETATADLRSPDLMLAVPDGPLPDVASPDTVSPDAPEAPVDVPEPDTMAPDLHSADLVLSVPDVYVPDLAIPDTALPDTRPPTPDTRIVPQLPLSSGPGTFTISGRTTSDIQVVVPANVGANPPLVFSFHGTSQNESIGISQFQLDTKAAQYGFIAIAPRAGYRDGQHPADVDHDLNEGWSSWNLWDMNPETNEDLRYIVALIDAAQQTYGVDTSRVYTMGSSNGAFFSYFAAASLPQRIAGFAENSGGWTTDQCPTRYGAMAAGQAYAASAAPTGVGVGQSFSCSVLFADPAFPSSCRISATNHMRPPALGARVPFGYLGHYSGDTTVSVQWSCILAEALGSRAKTAIRFSDTNASGHSIMPDFVDQAWAFFAGRTNTD